MSNAEFAVPGPGLESLGNKSLSGFFFWQSIYYVHSQ